MHSGLTPSSGQDNNEKHYSPDQLQVLTDHARRESMKRYASVQLIRGKEETFDVKFT